MKHISKTSLIGLGLIILFAVMCFFMLPITVQSGDTGELVTSAYHLRVAHPPGYPLWTLLYHFPVRYLSSSNPFWVASAFTLVIFLGAFSILGLGLKRLEAWFTLLVMMTSAVLWKYALLPDVFTLHVFFLALVSLVFVKPELLNRWWMIFLISLTVANHHTILFAFPLFLYALYESGITKKKILQCLVSGVVSFSLYFLLPFFHPDDYGSWRNIHSFQDILHHFLRSDYGTFQIAQVEAEGINWLSFFFGQFLRDAWALLVIPFFILFKEREIWQQNLKKTSTILISLVLYFITFSLMAKISLDVDGEIVFERFLIQPFLVLGLVSLYLLFKTQKALPVWISGLLVINIGWNIFNHHRNLDFSHKTGIHDLVINSFKAVPENGVFLLQGDSFGFAAYYMHDVLKVRSDIKLILTTWNFPWSNKKTRERYPEIFHPGKESTEIFELLKLNEYDLYTNYLAKVLPAYIGMSVEGITFRYFARKNNEPTSMNCDYDFEFITRPELKDFYKYETNAYFDMSYGMCEFMQGLEYFSTNRLEESEKYFKKAVSRSPFNARYLERLCHVQKMIRSPEFQKCSTKLDELLMETHEQYYLNKYRL